MKVSFYCCFLVVLQAATSIQAPVASTPLETSASRTLFHNFLLARPLGMGTQDAQEYAEKFASHPLVTSLRDLNQKDYADKVIELRSKVKDDAKARENFRKSIYHYMKEEQVHPDTIDLVKSRLTTASQREINARSVLKVKGSNLEGYKKSRKLSSQKQKQRKNQFTSIEIPFEQQMVMDNIAKDSDAYTIEERSRNFNFDSPIIATTRLRAYLKKMKFSDKDVQNAISKRGSINRQFSHANPNQRTKERRQKEMLSTGKKITLPLVTIRKDPPIKTQGRITSFLPHSTPVWTSLPRAEIGSQERLAHIVHTATAANPSQSSTTSSHYFPYADGTFENTEWWNDL